MQRCKHPLSLPQGCFTTVNPLPVGSQLLRSVPLRLNGGVADHVSKQCSELKEVGNQSESPLTEQAWGIPFTPEEFVQEAQLRGHPKLFTQLLPGILADAVHTNFCEDQATLVRTS